MAVGRGGVGGWGVRKRRKRRRNYVCFSSALQRAVAEAATEIPRSYGETLIILRWIRVGCVSREAPQRQRLLRVRVIV